MAGRDAGGRPVSTAGVDPGDGGVAASMQQTIREPSMPDGVTATVKAVNAAGHLRRAGRESGMLGDVAQTFAVGLIVAGAVAYLLVALRRWMRGEHGAGCSGCSLASTHAKLRKAALRKPAQATPRQMVPLESLAQIARRRSDERAAPASDSSRSPP